MVQELWPDVPFLGPLSQNMTMILSWPYVIPSLFSSVCKPLSTIVLSCFQTSSVNYRLILFLFANHIFSNASDFWWFLVCACYKPSIVDISWGVRKKCYTWAEVRDHIFDFSNFSYFRDKRAYEQITRRAEILKKLLLKFLAQFRHKSPQFLVTC